MVSLPYELKRCSGRLGRTLLPWGAVIALAAGCVTGSSAGDPVAGDQVRVVDNDFEPALLQVPAGDAVTWRWEGSSEHNVVGDGFESAIQDSGSFTHTFTDPGTYSYVCTLHRGMQAEILVTD